MTGAAALGLRRASSLAMVAVLTLGGCSVHGHQPIKATGAFEPTAGPVSTTVTGPIGPPAGWSIMRSGTRGSPLIATHLVRPPAGTPRAWAAAAWLSPTALRFELIPGLSQPGGTWSTNAEVPSDQRAVLAAVFNSGFKFVDIDGGFRAEGRTALPLRQGEASLAITRDGQLRVGAWGETLKDSADLVAVRQSLKLIVQHRQAVDGLLTRHDGSWSSKHHQVQRTPRSGIGVRPDGSIVYVVGPDLDLQELANALVAVGAVTAMQLDIHPNMTVFHIFQPGHGTNAGTVQPLLDVMTAPPTRYLVPDRRDFVAAIER